MSRRAAGVTFAPPVALLDCGTEDLMSEPAAPATADAMFSQVYDRLKAMAGRRLAMGPRGTLDTTVLVHDLYLRMSRRDGLAFSHPAQFFTYAARAMRHLLRDRARDRLRQRAGGDWVRITLTGGDTRLAIEGAEQALALDDALRRLEEDDARAAQVVELIWFAGLSHEQAAETLGLARRTIERDWRYARAFLKAHME
jgi:RNA polymerase sigma factor (TIGR02999 family)